MPSAASTTPRLRCRGYPLRHVGRAPGPGQPGRRPDFCGQDSPLSREAEPGDLGQPLRNNARLTFSKMCVTSWNKSKTRWSSAWFTTERNDYIINSLCYSLLLFRSRGLRRSVHPEFLAGVVRACRRSCRGARASPDPRGHPGSPGRINAVWHDGVAGARRASALLGSHWIRLTLGELAFGPSRCDTSYRQGAGGGLHRSDPCQADPGFPR